MKEKIQLPFPGLLNELKNFSYSEMYKQQVLEKSKTQIELIPNEPSEALKEYIKLQNYMREQADKLAGQRKETIMEYLPDFLKTPKEIQVFKFC